MISPAVQSADEAYQIFEKAVKEWRSTLGFDSWRIALVRLDREDSEIAACIADPVYKLIDLSVNPRKMLEEEYSQFQVESTAVHELVHARVWLCFDQLINPAIPEDIATFFEERLTEAMAASHLRARYPRRRKEIDALWAEFLVTREVAVNPS